MWRAVVPACARYRLIIGFHVGLGECVWRQRLREQCGGGAIGAGVSSHVGYGSESPRRASADASVLAAFNIRERYPQSYTVVNWFRQDSRGNCHNIIGFFSIVTQLQLLPSAAAHPEDKRSAAPHRRQVYTREPHIGRLRLGRGARAGGGRTRRLGRGRLAGRLDHLAAAAWLVHHNRGDNSNDRLN